MIDDMATAISAFTWGIWHNYHLPLCHQQYHDQLSHRVIERHFLFHHEGIRSIFFPLFLRMYFRTGSDCAIKKTNFLPVHVYMLSLFLLLRVYPQNATWTLINYSLKYIIFFVFYYIQPFRQKLKWLQKEKKTTKKHHQKQHRQKDSSTTMANVFGYCDCYKELYCKETIQCHAKNNDLLHVTCNTETLSKIFQIR